MERSERLPGSFIVFEGGEGSGKSTQVRLLAEAARSSGRSVVVTREPGGSDHAERIRRLILDDASHTLPAQAEALLFAAARCDHVAHTVRPAVARGDIVISDRFVDSSIAYQGVARGLGAERIRELNAWATAGFTPDLTIVLDVDPEVGLSRAKDANRMEAEPIEFHARVRAAFLELAAQHPGDHMVIDSAEPPQEVHRRVWAAAAELIGAPV